MDTTTVTERITAILEDEGVTSAVVLIGLPGEEAEEGDEQAAAEAASQALTDAGFVLA